MNLNGVVVFHCHTLMVVLYSACLSWRRKLSVLHEFPGVTPIYKYILALTKEKRGKKSQWFTQINLSGGIKTSSWSKKMRLRVCCFVRHWSWNLLIRKDLCHIPNRFYQSAAICRSAANEILRFFYLSFFFTFKKWNDSKQSLRWTD